MLLCQRLVGVIAWNNFKNQKCNKKGKNKDEKSQNIKQVKVGANIMQFNKITKT